MKFADRKELQEILLKEKKLYFPNYKDYINCLLLREHEYYIWKFQYLLRKEEYYIAKNNKFKRYIYHVRKNFLALKLGFFIPTNVFGEGLRIWHYGSIVINYGCSIGKNCTLHGQNCIGNDGKKGNICPVLGDNIDIGVGASVIGNVFLANDIKIGAGAVIVDSFFESGITIAGVPAKKVKG